VAVTFEPELAVPAVAHAQISRRTVLRIPETEILFTLQHGLTALAVARYPTASRAVIGAPEIRLDGVAGADSEDLRSGRPVPLLRAGGRAEARIGIVLREPPPARATLPISILFELDTAVRPEWDPDAAPASPPAQLRWEYRDTEGAWHALPRLSDGTLGLRRSGLVRFALPPKWSAYGEGHVGWLRVSTDAATFASPPMVLRIAPNSALATHRRWQAHCESPGWLPLPGRAVQLPASPPPLADGMYVAIEEPDRRRRWSVVPDLVGAGPADRVAVVDRVRARVVFGDGLTGRVPRLATGRAAPQVTVWYAAGGGVAGNVAPCAWETVERGALPGARSLVAAIGGRDPETLDEARARASSSLQRPERAVTPHDHEVIAFSTPGISIARAHAEVGLSRGECGVIPGVTTVFVVPGIAARRRDAVQGGSAVAAPIADPGALAEVRRRLERARLVGEAILVEPAAYRRLRVRVAVAAALREREVLRRRVEAVLRLYLDPLLGGDEQAGWPFGQPVRPTALLGMVQRELGDRGDVIAVAVAIDGGDPVSCQDVVIRPYELISVDAIEVAIQAARAAEGGLR
jgi:predicted phage baseplate assembly protein